MEKLSEHPGLGSMHVLENETTARAKEVLGSIPEWYRRNKERIEKSRSQQEKTNQVVLMELKRLKEKLEETWKQRGV